MTTFPTLMGQANYNHGRERPADLGERITDGHQALAAAGIDWTVTARPLSSFMSFYGRTNANRHHVSVRDTDGAIIGVNGTRHHPIQNEALAVLGDEIRKYRPDFQYVAGGSSPTGETCFLILESDELISFGDGDEGARSILLGTDHNGRSPVFGVATTFRFNCMNQFTMARRQGKRLFTVKHTSSADWQIAVARQAIEAQLVQFDAVDQELHRLMDVSADCTILQDVIGDRPDEGRAATNWDTAYANLVAEYTADWNTAHMGTAFGVVMAAQGADEHLSRTRGPRDMARVNRAISSRYPLMERALELVG